MDQYTDIELANLLGAPEDSSAVQQKAAMLAAALRKQQGQAQDQQAMSGLSGFFNAPGATTMGKAYGDIGAQQFESAEAQLQQMPKVQLQRAMAQQAAAKASLERQQRLGDKAEERTYQEGRDARQNGAALQRAHVMAGLKADEREAKATEGTSVPGYEVVPGEAPTKDDAKAMKLSLAAAEKMGRFVGEMRGLYQKHGTEMVGPVANRMKQLRTQMKIEGKNIAELGALSGPDEALMNQLVGEDPTSLWANAKGLVGADNVGESLSGLETWVGDALKGGQVARGYRPKGGAGDAARSSAGLSTEKATRLAELRAKKAKGALK